MQQILSVKINSPEKIIWEGKAKWVSSTNSSGNFDILPYHANFITYVENSPIKVKTEEKVESYTFSRAVIYNQNNNVSIYVNI
jgi:F0F1-type ATP synthase epsilon subunit